MLSIRKMQKTQKIPKNSQKQTHKYRACCKSMDFPMEMQTRPERKTRTLYDFVQRKYGEKIDFRGFQKRRNVNVFVRGVRAAVSLG